MFNHHHPEMLTSGFTSQHAAIALLQGSDLPLASATQYVLITTVKFRQCKLQLSDVRVSSLTVLHVCYIIVVSGQIIIIISEACTSFLLYYAISYTSVVITKIS